MAVAGAMLCFHSSCISACMTSSELCGRWMLIWPSASPSASSSSASGGGLDSAPLPSPSASFPPPRNDAPHAELARHAQRQRADDCARAQVRQVVAVPAHALLRAVVAVDKGRVGRPRVRALVLQLPTARIPRRDAVLDLPVDGLLNPWLGLIEQRGDLADILSSVNVCCVEGGMILQKVGAGGFCRS